VRSAQSSASAPFTYITKAYNQYFSLAAYSRIEFFLDLLG